MYPLEGSRVIRAIRSAFGTVNVPQGDDFLEEHVQIWRPFEAEELERELLGRTWSDVADEFIAAHPDWLLYLSPVAFAYYLPAYLIYCLDLHAADYAGSFLVGILGQEMRPGKSDQDPMEAYADALGLGQKCAVRDWYDYLVSHYPEDVPAAGVNSLAARAPGSDPR